VRSSQQHWDPVFSRAQDFLDVNEPRIFAGRNSEHAFRFGKDESGAFTSGLIDFPYVLR
jgi:hypothetical protein